MYSTYVQYIHVRTHIIYSMRAEFVNPLFNKYFCPPLNDTNIKFFESRNFPMYTDTGHVTVPTHSPQYINTPTHSPQYINTPTHSPQYIMVETEIKANTLSSTLLVRR
jgi:hypothetical protein